MQPYVLFTRQPTTSDEEDFDQIGCIALAKVIMYMEENSDMVFQTKDLIQLYKDSCCRSNTSETVNVYVNTKRFIDRLIQHLSTLKRVMSGETVVLSFDLKLSSVLNTPKADTFDKETLVLMRAAKLVRKHF